MAEGLPQGGEECGCLVGGHGPAFFKVGACAEDGGDVASEDEGAGAGAEVVGGEMHA